jgi:hypothetical protein
MVTCVALDAVMVSVEEAPAAIAVGLAVTETAGPEVACPEKFEPQPVTNAMQESSIIGNATEEWRRDRNRGKTLFDT